MEGDGAGAVGGGVHVLSSSWIEKSWQWYEAAEPLCALTGAVLLLKSGEPGLLLHVSFAPLGNVLVLISCRRGRHRRGAARTCSCTVEGWCDTDTQPEGPITTHHSEADHGSGDSSAPGLPHLLPPSLRCTDHHWLLFILSP